MPSLNRKDIITTKVLTREDYETIFERAKYFENKVKDEGKTDNLEDEILATLFFEPSTRTRFSFQTAMFRLGGDVIGMSSAKTSSVAKGESLSDTVKTVGRYADNIVIRHPDEGSAKIASESTEVPVLNAGDGSNEHPTQTLLDLYTIKNEKGRIDDLKVGMIGDLGHARVINSLSYALPKFNCKIFFIAPDKSLKIRNDVRNHLEDNNVDFVETDNLDEVLDKLDVLYTLRVQEERFETKEKFEKVKNSYKLTPKTLEGSKEDLILMHPLPRVDELSRDLDDTRMAKYFPQAENGVYVRMALLDLIGE